MTLYRSVAGLSTVGVSLGHREVGAADHWILSLDPAPVSACTHLVQTPFPHVAISLVSASPFETSVELQPAADAALSGKFGRAVIFPGSSTLTGQLTVGALIESTAIDRVEVLGSGVALSDQIVDTRDFVRPQFRNGDLVLVTMPAAGGVLVPFETRDPTPCCADHK
ncbi:hypothetical protein KOI35_40430 [Actinoplanes bogorensis]|uniref:Uncharacterized protein n=1 Tax=Paractinoplanes bogorensis TaxID=1610840 RepID=A0ABS5Z5S5_9ACTN|nr:hypothetical protein [Actinoplanes bogorensis]MBU2669795.1 hypothetical protein [Actinoplanes bogorensis]